MLVFNNKYRLVCNQTRCDGESSLVWKKLWNVVLADILALACSDEGTMVKSVLSTMCCLIVAVRRDDGGLRYDEMWIWFDCANLAVVGVKPGHIGGQSTRHALGNPNPRSKRKFSGRFFPKKTPSEKFLNLQNHFSNEKRSFSQFGMVRKISCFDPAIGCISSRAFEWPPTHGGLQSFSIKVENFEIFFRKVQNLSILVGPSCFTCSWNWLQFWQKRLIQCCKCMNQPHLVKLSGLLSYPRGFWRDVDCVVMLFGEKIFIREKCVPFVCNGDIHRVKGVSGNVKCWVKNQQAARLVSWLGKMKREVVFVVLCLLIF